MTLLQHSGECKEAPIHIVLHEQSWQTEEAEEKASRQRSKLCLNLRWKKKFRSDAYSIVLIREKLQFLGRLFSCFIPQRHPSSCSKKCRHPSRKNCAAILQETLNISYAKFVLSSNVKVLDKRLSSWASFQHRKCYFFRVLLRISWYLLVKLQSYNINFNISKVLTIEHLKQ